MKKLLSIALASTLVTSLYANTFVGVKMGSGSGKVKISSSSNTAYTFTDSDSITTKDLQVYVGSGHLYLFYQKGTIKTDTIYMNDFDYNAFGVGYYASWKSLTSGKIKVAPEFMIGIGYDSLSGKGSGPYDDDKNGILIPISLGVSVFPKGSNIKFTADIGYDIHVVNDDTSTNGYDGSWNFDAIRYNIGARYDF